METHTKAVIHGIHVAGITLDVGGVAVQVVVERGQISIVHQFPQGEMVVWGFTFLNSI